MRYLDLLHRDSFQRTARALADTIAFFSLKGWVPATSSNFSARIPNEIGLFAISKSGVDKSCFSIGDLMVVDAQGKAVAPMDARPSAETLLHMLLYEDAAVGSVLHTHSMAATVLSMRHLQAGRMVFNGLEILKGLRGVKTHEASVELPIFANSQDMVALAEEIRQYGRAHPEIHGFIIAGHGLYTWGENVFEAKRHVETLEFLLEYAFVR